MQGTCPICQSSASAFHYANTSTVTCERCGEFGISAIAAHEISCWTSRQRTNLSGWVRENQNFDILSDKLKYLAELQTPTVGQKAQKLLEQFSTKSFKAGTKVDILTDNGRKSELAKYLFSVSPNSGWQDVVQAQLIVWSWSEDFEELSYLLNDFLIREIGVIDYLNDGNIRITPKGWSFLDSLHKNEAKGQIGFIAMWFNESVNNAWLAIDKGIRDAGYKAFRVDQKEHNNDITDEIIAGIRGCKFLVADLTGHRNGVYYEAGFAKGLGLEVIWSCRKDHEKDRHFDIRQLSTIFWEEDKLPELSKALKDRIVATIGRGPLAGTN